MASFQLRNVVVVCTGVTLAMMTGDVRKTVSAISGVMQDHYPETLGKTFIINAPFVFKAVWAIVKPMLAPNTVKKVCFKVSTLSPHLYLSTNVSNITHTRHGRGWVLSGEGRRCGCNRDRDSATTVMHAYLASSCALCSYCALLQPFPKTVS